MRKLPALIAFLIGVALTSAANACMFPPENLITHHRTLVAESNTIVLARVIGKIGPLAKFARLETVRGETSQLFTLPNGYYLAGSPKAAADFDAHTDLAFWDERATRNSNDSDCRMRPYFVQGRAYLLFLNNPHWRAYEEIVSPDDLWLQAVRKLVEQPGLDSGLSMTIEERLARSQGVFVGTIESCSGPTLRVDEILTGQFTDTWRYSSEEVPRYWPYPDCEVGKQYLVETYIGTRWSWPFASAFPIEDGEIDFTYLVKKSEISFTGRAVKTIADVRDALR